MYIQDFIPTTDEVLDRALASPKLKKGCDIATVVRAVHEAVEAIAKDALRDEIIVALSDAAAAYEAVNGKYEAIPDGPEHDRARSEYESGIDDTIEAALEPYEQHLSADWLGRSTIGTLAWKDDELKALAVSAGKEVWKQMTYEKTPAQILASAGIVQKDIENRLAQPPKTQTKTEGTMTVSEQLEALLQNVRAHIGNDFDHVAVYDDLDMILTEDDELLVNGAASRLGMSENEVNTMQIAALAMDEATSEMFEMLKSTKTKAAKPAKATKAAKDAKSVENAIDPLVMSTMKATGTQDTAMAEALGVSRSTYLKYCNGTSAFVPSNEQHDLIRTEIVGRTNMLLKALAALDGVDATEVA